MWSQTYLAYFCGGVSEPTLAAVQGFSDRLLCVDTQLIYVINWALRGLFVFSCALNMGINPTCIWFVGRNAVNRCTRRRQRRHRRRHSPSNNSRNTRKSSDSTHRKPSHGAAKETAQHSESRIGNIGAPVNVYLNSSPPRARGNRGRGNRERENIYIDGIADNGEIGSYSPHQSRAQRSRKGRRSRRNGGSWPRLSSRTSHSLSSSSSYSSEDLDSDDIRRARSRVRSNSSQGATAAYNVAETAHQVTSPNNATNASRSSNRRPTRRVSFSDTRGPSAAGDPPCPIPTTAGSPEAPQDGLSPTPAAQPTIEVDNGAGVWPPGLRPTRPATPSDDEVSTGASGTTGSGSESDERDRAATPSTGSVNTLQQWGRDFDALFDATLARPQRGRGRGRGARGGQRGRNTRGRGKT